MTSRSQSDDFAYVIIGQPIHKFANLKGFLPVMTWAAAEVTADGQMTTPLSVGTGHPCVGTGDPCFGFGDPGVGTRNPRFATGNRLVGIGCPSFARDHPFVVTGHQQ